MLLHNIFLSVRINLKTAMCTLVQSINLEIERRSLLKHQFYRLWSEGKLDLDQLRGYSLEYFQLVKAVPGLVTNILANCTNDEYLRRALNENREEESEHIHLWTKFGGCLGLKPEHLDDHVSSGATEEAVSQLSTLTTLSLGQGAAAMYAYEKQLPEISRSKIDGLRQFYSIGDGTEGLKYFFVHERVDIRHAALWKTIIETVSDDQAKSLLTAATDSLGAQNKLLDSVYDRYIEQAHS
jgi:pyrroloquinoline-quinone synthase